MPGLAQKQKNKKRTKCSQRGQRNITVGRALILYGVSLNLIRSILYNSPSSIKSNTKYRASSNVRVLADVAPKQNIKKNQTPTSLKYIEILGIMVAVTFVTFGENGEEDEEREEDEEEEGQ